MYMYLIPHTTKKQKSQKPIVYVMPTPMSIEHCWPIFWNNMTLYPESRAGPVLHFKVTWHIEAFFRHLGMFCSCHYCEIGNMRYAWSAGSASVPSVPRCHASQPAAEHSSTEQVLTQPEPGSSSPPRCSISEFNSIAGDCTRTTLS